MEAGAELPPPPSPPGDGGADGGADGLPPPPAGGGAAAPGSNPPSRVLHVRSLPPGATAEEIAVMAAPFGRLTRLKTSVGPKADQALVEYAELAGAVSLVEYFARSGDTPRVRGKPVVAQYSKSAELADGAPLAPVAAPFGAGAAMAGGSAYAGYGAPQAAPAGGGMLGAPHGGHGGHGGAGGAGGPGGGESRVLRVHVDPIPRDVPLTLGGLLSLFQPYGGIMKATVTDKSDGPRAQFTLFVQYSDVAAARMARDGLHGRPLPPFLLGGFPEPAIMRCAGTALRHAAPGRRPAHCAPRSPVP